MRSFVILSLLASTSTFAAPVPAFLTGALEQNPAVSQLTGTAGQLLKPVTDTVPGVVNTVDGLTGSQVPGEVVDEALTAAGQVKRSPITEVLNEIPGVSEVSQTAGKMLSPVTGQVPGVLNTVSTLPGGEVVSGLAENALGLLGSVKRRALTSALEGLPGVPEATAELGQLLDPVTGKLLPEAESTLQGLPGGSALVGLINGAEGALGSVKRRALTSILDGIPGVQGLTEELGQLLSPVTGKLLPEAESTLQGLPGGSALVNLINGAEGTLSGI